MGRLEERIRRLEERQGLRKKKPKHGCGVPSEEIARQVRLALLERTTELAKERGEPYQELGKLQNEYAGLSVEEQIERYDEFAKNVAQLAPKASKALSEELDKELARI